MTSEAADVAIGDAAPEERDSLVQVLEKSFTGIYLRHAKRILEEVESVRVARLGDETIGLAMLKLLGEEAGYVYYIAVVPSFRGRGIGGRLVKDSIEFFARARAVEVYASVGEHNVESNALFKGQGFRRTDFGQVSKRYGAFKALSMYRSMWVVPGEVILVKETLEPAAVEHPGPA